MFIFSFLSYTAPQVFHCSVFSFTQSFHIYLRCFMFLKSSIVISLLCHVFYGSAFVFAVSGFLWEGTEGIKDDNWPWASWSPSARSSWWWGRPPTPQTSWWRRSAPCLCSGTWRRRRRSPLRSFRSSRTSPSSGCTGWHPEGGNNNTCLWGSQEAGVSLQRGDAGGVVSGANLTTWCFYVMVQLKLE